MFKTKLLTGVLLVLAVLFAQVGTAFAAPVGQETTITGTIVSVIPETDTNGVTTVLVTYKDAGLVAHHTHKPRNSRKSRIGYSRYDGNSQCCNRCSSNRRSRNDQSWDCHPG